MALVAILIDLEVFSKIELIGDVSRNLNVSACRGGQRFVLRFPLNNSYDKPCSKSEQKPEDRKVSFQILVRANFWLALRTALRMLLWKEMDVIAL